MRSSSFRTIFSKACVFALAGILIGFSSYLFPSKTNVLATGGQDQCNQETTYTVDEDDESHLTFSETGNRVDVDFNGNGDDRNQAIITAGTNYTILTVRYDNESSNTNWINFSVSNPTTTINLAGTSDSTRIDKVEVKVKKVCVTPTPSPTPSPTPTVTPTPSPTPTEPVGQCDEGYHYNQEEESCDPDEQEPSVTPTPTGDPGDLCINIDGIQTSIPDGHYKNSDATGCLPFQLGGPPPPPAAESTGQVLGASTMAGTGVAKDSIFYGVFILGSILSAFGIRKVATS